MQQVTGSRPLAGELNAEAEPFRYVRERWVFGRLALIASFLPSIVVSRLVHLNENCRDWN